jgi:hypothetical protein
VPLDRRDALLAAGVVAVVAGVVGVGAVVAPLLPGWIHP